MKKMFEKILWNTRFVVVLAVISSLVGMFLLFALATMDMAHLIWEFIEYAFLGVPKEDFHVTAVAHIITAVDDFLLATVLLIFALGLYELFINKLDIGESKGDASNILLIRSLDDLKDRLGKVVLMILVVAFFKNVMYVSFDDPLNILYMGAGILLVSLALYFSNKSGKH